MIRRPRVRRPFPVEPSPCRLGLLAALAGCLLACATTAAPAVVPLAQPIDVPPERPAEAWSTVEPAASPVVVPTAPDGDEVAPERMLIEVLPVADYPPMLLAGNAPITLPPGDNPLTRKPPLPLKNGGIVGGMVRAGDHPLTRLQVGDVRMTGYAGQNTPALCESDIAAWRAAGGGPKTATAPPSPRDLSTLPPPGFAPKYSPPKPTFSGIRPARWETLTRDRAGKVVLTVTDAWFDFATCNASVQRETTIEPSPVLGGLAFAFRGHCVDCGDREVVTFVAPNLRTASGANIARGAFMIVRMTYTERGGGTFVGFADAWGLRRFRDATDLGGDHKTQRAVLGLEIEWSMVRKTHSINFLGALAP